MVKHTNAEMWKYPLPHNFQFEFGLSILSAGSPPNKASTIIPYVFQDNAIVDYETIKTNPENADFTVSARANCAAGSTVSKIFVKWMAFNTEAGGAEIGSGNLFNTMNMHTAFLSRLDAFDKKTNNDIETILELTHETTDEQTYPLYNGTKLHGPGAVGNGLAPSDQPGLTTNQAYEGVNFDKEMFFDAMHYYTNKEMLKTVTDPMKVHRMCFGKPTRGSPIVVYGGMNDRMNSLCKYMNPYTFHGELFHLPQAGAAGVGIEQPIVSSEVTAIEHLRVMGQVRFLEFNPDFNFARA